MKYKAKCTNCIPQVCNLYPDRKENPIHTEEKVSYIEVETLYEKLTIEDINKLMGKALIFYRFLEIHLEETRL